MADGYYYFGCTVSFDCPICCRTSVERMVYTARTLTPERVARAVSRQALDCQLCGAAVTHGKRLRIQVLPATPEQLKMLGFAIRPAA